MQPSHQTHPTELRGHKTTWATYEYKPHWAWRPMHIPQYVADVYQGTVENTCRVCFQAGKALRGCRHPTSRCYKRCSEFGRQVEGYLLQHPELDHTTPSSRITPVPGPLTPQPPAEDTTAVPATSESFVTRMMYVIEHFPFEPQLVGEEHWAQETKMELRRIREEVRILRAHIKQARLQAHTTDTKVQGPNTGVQRLTQIVRARPADVAPSQPAKRARFAPPEPPHGPEDSTPGRSLLAGYWFSMPDDTDESGAESLPASPCFSNMKVE